MNITITDMDIRVDGKIVATARNRKALGVLVEALCEQSKGKDAVLLALSALGGEAKTAEVAEFLGQDRSNTGRRLEALAEQGRVRLTDKAHKTGKAGRPSRVWELA
jgi:predicted ArsR family transcriptional regulator